MALASADIPALLVTGGFRQVPVTFRGERLGSGTSAVALRTTSAAPGGSADADWARLETCLGAGPWCLQHDGHGRPPWRSWPRRWA